MDKTHAQPGDTIEATRASSEFFGKRLLVVNPPKGTRLSRVPDGIAWVDDGSGYPSYFLLDNYKIIDRSRKAPNNETNRDVDTFLNEQRDHNLHSVFG